jgi:nucleotide-binding universal stress UspA family protein
MPGPIVVGYDGTEGAKGALAEALRLAGPLGAEVVLGFAYHATPLGGNPHEMLDLLRDRGRIVLEEGLQQVRAAGLEGRGELVNDRPAEGLADLVASEGAQMVVVGSYSEAPLKALIVGSTPLRLPHITSAPVLIVRGAI